jgi:hypothetical protein
MARKNKNKEVRIEATKLDSDVVTDLEVLVDDELAGKIHQGEEDRHFQVTNLKDQKGTALSVEDAVQSILSDYNLYN